MLCFCIVRRGAVGVVSICCVGFVSLDVVYDELKDCAWNIFLEQLSN